MRIASSGSRYPKHFSIKKAITAQHYDVETSDETWTFYVDITLRGFVLHLGRNKESPVIAYKSFFTRKIMIRIEDLEDPKLTRWEQIRKSKSSIMPNYRWTVTDDEGERATLLWVRTLLPSYRLLDAENRELAKFTGSLGPRISGTLRLSKANRRRFELILLTTFMALYTFSTRVHIY